MFAVEADWIEREERKEIKKRERREREVREHTHTDTHRKGTGHMHRIERCLSKILQINVISVPQASSNHGSLSALCPSYAPTIGSLASCHGPHTPISPVGPFKYPGVGLD